MKFTTKASLILAPMLVGVLAVELHKAAVRKIERGELYERHVVSGKPTVDVYISGFTDQKFDAYFVDGSNVKEMFDGLECYFPDFERTTNVRKRDYEGTCGTTRRDWLPMFTILWSPDSKRVGIAYHGYFVAAYDRISGERMQFADYPETRDVRGSDGMYLQHDYKRCDEEIERFLQ